MATSVTENWSERTCSLKPPWRMTRAFIVGGVSDQFAALRAVDASTGLAVPQRNAQWGTSTLRCEGPEISSWEGPTTAKVVCSYSVPASGEFDENDPEKNPLDEPAIYTVEQIEITEPYDKDVGGRPVRNSAGDPFNPPPSRTICMTRIRVQRNEPFWDQAKSAAYENRVNSRALTVGGVPVAVEHCRCASIRPVASFKAGDPYVPIGYVLEALFNDDLGLYPFQNRLLDKGQNGYYTKDGNTIKAKLYDGDGNPVTGDELLDGTGKPKNSTIKVGKDKLAPVANPNTVTPYKNESTTDGYWMIYQRCETADLGALGL